MTSNLPQTPKSTNGRHRHTRSTASAATRGGFSQGVGHHPAGHTLQSPSMFTHQPYPIVQGDAQYNTGQHLQGFPPPNYPSSMFPGNHDMRGNVSDEAALSGLDNSSTKKKARQKPRQNGTNSVQTPPAARYQSSSPSQEYSSNNQSKNKTQIKNQSTPVKAAYAGPTFHASPAPSSLPMPSFFSKSMPDPTAKLGLQAMVEDSSEDSQDSPTLQTARSTSARQNRDESPLDFFFRADREEKARAAKSPEQATPNTIADGQIAAYQRSPTPSPARPRLDHSRNPTSGSGNEMFRFDMEGQGSNHLSKPATPIFDRTSPVQLTTAPITHNGNITPEEAERKAKSQALKALLMTTHLKGPVSSPLERKPSPSSRAPQYHPPLQEWTQYAPVSNGHTSVRPTSASASIPVHNNQTYGLARPSQRSSYLRQEVIPPDVGNAHPQSFASPSPGPPSVSAASQDAHRPQTDSPSLFRRDGNLASHVAPPPSFPHSPGHGFPENQAPARPAEVLPASTVDVLSMENDLRRILKLGARVVSDPGRSNEAVRS